MQATVTGKNFLEEGFANFCLLILVDKRKLSKLSMVC